MNAETAYLFRHAVLRDAAYQLQLPADRAKLHALAFEIIEALLGGPPPAPQSNAWGKLTWQPHAVDSVCRELAEHAAQGAEELGPSAGEREVAYLRRAGWVAQIHYRLPEAARCKQMAAEHPALPEPLRAKLLSDAGMTLYEAGFPGPGEELILRSIALARARGSKEDLLGASLERALILRETGHVDEAEATYEKALATCGSGFPRLRAIALANLSLLYDQRGAIDKCCEAARAAIEIFRGIGDANSEAITMNVLAGVLSQTGKPVQAEQLYLAALEIQRRAKDRTSESILLGNLAIFADDSGQPERAKELLDQALTLAREIGSRRYEAIQLNMLASLQCDAGKTHQAVATLEEAIALHREVGNRRGEGVAWTNLAEFLMELGLVDRAEEAYANALSLHRSVRHFRFEAIHHCNFSRWLLARGRESEARQSWNQGAAMLEKIGDLAELEQRRRSMKQACQAAGLRPLDEAPAG